MSQAPVPVETARGYIPPTVTQFSIFLANRVGRMHEMTKRFDEHRCRICAMGVHEASDHAVVRIVASNADEARKILRDQSLPFIETEIIVVVMDVDHTLSQICEHLLRAELSIRFAYPLFGTAAGLAGMVLAVDDMTLAGQILRRKEFRLLGEGDLPKFGE